MKPPFRTRTKPKRSLNPASVTSPQSTGKVNNEWQRGEQRKLLNGLKRQSRASKGNSDIDYALLKKNVTTRSISEIHSAVESLKKKVISCASLKLKKKKSEEKEITKPIEVWTHMASAMAGVLEESIFAAFSQMLIVSSTEPRTLRNCDPPQVHRPPTDEGKPVGRTITFRPMPRLPVKGELPGTTTSAFLAPNTQVLTMVPAKRHPAPSQVVTVPKGNIPSENQLSYKSGSLSVATFTTQPAATSHHLDTAEHTAVPSTSLESASQIVKPLTRHITPISSCAALAETRTKGSSVIQTIQLLSDQQCTSHSTSSTFVSCSPYTTLSSSITSLTPVSSTGTSSVASSSVATSTCSSPHPVTPLNSPTMALHATFGRTSKYATIDSPRTFGVKCVVDFERIYHYLSIVHKPDMDCHLTPMESAIILDLLMCLPEEICLLNCNELHKHLIQVYQCLSSSADSRTIEVFKDLREKLSDQTEAQKRRSSNRKDIQHHTIGTGNSSNVTDSREENMQPNKPKHLGASESSNTQSQSEDGFIMGPCPPLNPFMVPLKLLMRR